jgi:predicted acetyltransferase
MSYNLSAVIKDLSLSKNENKLIDPGKIEAGLKRIKQDDEKNDAYIIATLNEALDKVNDIVFLSLAQEQKLHDLATRIQVLRDEVLKINKNR